MNAIRNSSNLSSSVIVKIAESQGVSQNSLLGPQLVTKDNKLPVKGRRRAGSSYDVMINEKDEEVAIASL